MSEPQGVGDGEDRTGVWGVLELWTQRTDNRLNMRNEGGKEAEDASSKSSWFGNDIVLKAERKDKNSDCFVG